MRLWFLALFDALFALPWRRPTPDEVIRAETERLPGPIRSAPLHPAAMTMRFAPPNPAADLPRRPSDASERHAHLARQAARRMRARFPDGRGIH